jgi:hypothetical protein
VYCQVPLEVVEVGLREPGPADDAGVVHHDVDAPEPLGRRVDQGLRPGGRGHVASVAHGGAAGGHDLGGHGGRRPGVLPDAVHRAAQVVHDDARAPLGEEQRVSPADAAPGARHHGDPPVEAVVRHR